MELITERDEEALKWLTDIRVVNLPLKDTDEGAGRRFRDSGCGTYSPNLSRNQEVGVNTRGVCLESGV